MKTIILAAGKGERLLPLTQDRPKVLIDLGDGSTLLSRQFKNLSKRSRLGELVIGAGHCVGKVEEYAAALAGGPKVHIAYNPFFNIAGPLVTLWVALNRLDDSDFMFMNGDTIFSGNVYDRIEELLDSHDEGIYLFCSENPDRAPDDILVKLDVAGKVLAADKRLRDSDLVSAGLMLVKGGSSRARFRETLDRVSRTPEFLSHDKTWHSFIGDLADSGVTVEPIEIPKNEWMEIDIHFELKELQSILIHKVADTHFA